MARIGVWEGPDRLFIHRRVVGQNTDAQNGCHIAEIPVCPVSKGTRTVMVDEKVVVQGIK